MAKSQFHPTFEVRFIGAGITPEQVPIRAVSDALSAIQDIAAGRDPFESRSVPVGKGISLSKVSSGSARYACVSRSPDEAKQNLRRAGELLASAFDADSDDDGLIAALNPIQHLSEIAKSIECNIEVSLLGQKKSRPLFSIDSSAFQRLSDKLMLEGETTVIGRVVRAGGATQMRCMMRVDGRRRGLYCSVDNQDLIRRLGQHLYEPIVATGTATWIHR